MQKRQLSLLIPLLLASNVQAIEMYNDDELAMNFKGNLSVFYLRDSNGESEINDGFSRYLFDMKRQIKGDWQAIGLLEWGMQMSNTNDKLLVNNNGLTSTGPASESIWIRQGFVGVGNEKYGQLTLGKQWGVSYDAGYNTDWFELFGGAGSGTYNFGTDGGFSGTGRAEQAMQYRLSLNNLSVALQFQASADETHITGEDGSLYNGTLNFSNSSGLSLIYQAPHNIKLIAAYNRAKINLISENTISQSVDDELLSLSFTYGLIDLDGFGAISRGGLYFSMIYADMKNHDSNDIGQVMESSTGIEIYTGYRFENDIALILGYQSLEDTSSPGNPLGSDGTFHKEYAVVSVKYHWDNDFVLYMESKIDNSTLAEDTTSFGEDAMAVGMVFTF